MIIDGLPFSYLIEKKQTNKQLEIMPNDSWW